MSYVIIKGVVDDAGIPQWHITFETGDFLEVAQDETTPDAFSVVDNYCQEQGIPLPTEWRYE